MSYPILQLNSPHKPWVSFLQTRLNQLVNAGLSADGAFGPKTERAVKAFQQASNIAATGVVNEATWKQLEKHPKGSFLVHAEIDLLSDNQYVRSTSKKVGICLHHTAGDGNPHRVRDVWNGDDRGRVATHFVVGRTMTNGDSNYNGKVIQCMPLENWGYHIATPRMGFDSDHNEKTNSGYIGIEICNWGMLKKEGNSFVNYTGQKVPDSQVVVLDKPFRTYKYWHAYTTAQLQAVEELVVALAQRFDFDMTPPFAQIDESWLELSWEAMRRDRTLTTHTNFEYGKFDCFPQPEFLDMLRRIYQRL